MKRIAYLGLVVAVALLSVASVTNAEGPVGVRLDCHACDGDLTVVGGEGTEVTVVCSHGFIVFQGIAHGGHCEMRVPHTGPGPEGVVLAVGVGGEVFLIDTDDDWIWE